MTCSTAAGATTTSPATAATLGADDFALPETPPGGGQGVHGAGVRDGGNGGNTPLPGTQQQAPDFKTQRGTSGDDSLYGGDGKDHLYGGDGDDSLYGDKGYYTDYRPGIEDS